MLPATFAGVRYNRDLEGVHACILQAVLQAQGHGCGPGFLGVCIGGDRAEGYAFAKQQLLRLVDDVNPVSVLAELEARVVDDANRLGIGPMGFGGKLTIGACKIGSLNRLPASFFVSVAYMCWAYRRRGMVLDQRGEIMEWLYQEPGEFDAAPAVPAELVLDRAQVRTLQTPLDEETVRSLRVGDMVLLNGTICTGRDAVHKYLHQGGELEIIRGGILYHCGPVVLEQKAAIPCWRRARPLRSVRSPIRRRSSAVLASGQLSARAVWANRPGRRCRSMAASISMPSAERRKFMPAASKRLSASTSGNSAARKLFGNCG